MVARLHRASAAAWRGSSSRPSQLGMNFYLRFIGTSTRAMQSKFLTTTLTTKKVNWRTMLTLVTDYCTGLLITDIADIILSNLKTGRDEVPRGFEFHPLRQRVCSLPGRLFLLVGQ